MLAVPKILISGWRTHQKLPVMGFELQAERLLKRCLEIQQRHSGEGNVLQIAATRTQLGGMSIAQADAVAAEGYLQAALEEIHKALGDKHPDTALARCRLASCRADLGRQAFSSHPTVY